MKGFWKLWLTSVHDVGPRNHREGPGLAHASPDVRPQEWPPTNAASRAPGHCEVRVFLSCVVWLHFPDPASVSYLQRLPLTVLQGRPGFSRDAPNPPSLQPLLLSELPCLQPSATSPDTALREAGPTGSTGSLLRAHAKMWALAAVLWEEPTSRLTRCWQDPGPCLMCGLRQHPHTGSLLCFEANSCLLFLLERLMG